MKQPGGRQCGEGLLRAFNPVHDGLADDHLVQLVLLVGYVLAGHLNGR